MLCNVVCAHELESRNDSDRVPLYDCTIFNAETQRNVALGRGVVGWLREDVAQECPGK